MSVTYRMSIFLQLNDDFLLFGPVFEQCKKNITMLHQKIHFSPQDKAIFLLMYVRIFSDHPRTKYHELHDTESVSYHFKCFNTINGSDFEQIIWFLCVTHFKGPVIHTFMLKYGEALFKYHR